jgi:AcrR family transcriptional regulator
VTIDQTEINIDRRRERRERNRDAVVEAMLSLYRDGRFAPSSDEIAERAAVSPRSLFRYFDDLDDLVRAAIDRQLERVRPTLAVEIDVDQPLEVRVDRLVAQRLAMFDAMSSVGVVARLRAPFQPLIADELTAIRALLRRQVEALFQPELGLLGKDRAHNLLAAADVVCSFESAQLLRFDHGLSRARSGRVMTDALIQLFAR